MNIIKLLKIKNRKTVGYSDLSSREKKEILKKAISGANEEQAEMVRHYGNSGSKA